MSSYGVIGYHVTLSEGHMIANHPIKGNTCAPSCGNCDLFVTNLFILYVTFNLTFTALKYVCVNHGDQNVFQWNESGFRPPLCTYRLNWARRTSWGWWDDWDDTVLQTQDSKFEPWRSEAEHATSRSRRLPTILTKMCFKAS